MDDHSLNQVLRQAKTPIKLVVLRDNKDKPMKKAHTDEDVEGMKEDLALAMIEVESAQQENQDLTHEVEK